MDAGVEQHGGIFAIGHAERLGAGEASERDLARRRLPGPRMRLFPAERPPTRAAIERRSAIVTDAKTGKSRAAICWRHDRGRLLSAAYTGKERASSATSQATLYRRQQGGGDPAILGEQHVIGAAGRAPFHCFEP